VTLIFARSNYEHVARAYLAGLKRASEAGMDLRRIASVASFFVSRVDSAVDSALDEIGNQELQGNLAIANAKLAYKRFKQIFAGDEWQRLAGSGARVQRPLWASTSTKNPSYPDTLYVDELIGPSTVNTVPPATLDSYLDHGEVQPSLERGLDQAEQQLAALKELGIDFDTITHKLQEDGVEAFANSYRNLIAAIEDKCERMKAQPA
jgi:transaldolase